MKCRCGCEGDAVWLMTGIDLGGYRFVDEPACESAAAYCEEAAAECEKEFTKRRIN